MIDTSRMLPEEKKKFDFEIASGMRNRQTGELLPQFAAELEPKDDEPEKDKEGDEGEPNTEEPKKRTRKTKE